MTGLKGLMAVFLQPGELFVANDSYQIRTTLGSCVSITLWHPGARVGGMSHFLLPTRGTAKGGVALDGRYGDEALGLLLTDLKALGVKPLTCQAKIFGGGNMFPGHARAGVMTVGERNGRAAKSLLERHRIEVVSENLYGHGHRQIIFNVRNGEVWARQVKPARFDANAHHHHAAKRMHA